jgi:hypothetical protein
MNNININNEGIYNINISSTLKEKFNDELYIKKLLDHKIEEIKVNGFYLDLIELPNFHIDGKDRLNKLEYDIKNICSNHLSSDFKITDYYKVIGRYIKDNYFHTFVHVLPNDFTFNYVDMSNISNIMNISRNTIYANTFYGIYIKNDILHMHDIIQYDIFKQAFFINQCNIYDGGNDILGYSDNKYNHEFSISGSNKHDGAIFSSWVDYIQRLKNVYKYTEQQINTNIELLKEQLNKAEMCREQILLYHKKSMDEFQAITF